MNGGSVIARARRRNHTSQSALAEYLHTTASAVSRWESGRVEPSFATVVRAVEACAADLGALLSEPELDPHDSSLLETTRTLSPSARLQRLIDTVRFIESGRRSGGLSA